MKTLLNFFYSLIAIKFNIKTDYTDLEILQNKLDYLAPKIEKHIVYRREWVRTLQAFNLELTGVKNDTGYSWAFNY